MWRRAGFKVLKTNQLSVTGEREKGVRRREMEGEEERKLEEGGRWRKEKWEIAKETIYLELTRGRRERESKGEN